MRKLQSVMIAMVLSMSLSTVAFGQTEEGGDNESHGGRVVSPVSGKYGRAVEQGVLQTLELMVKVLRASGVYVMGR